MRNQSMASLTISFGMAAIPVDLFTTTLTSENITSHLLHAKDGSRLKQQYVCIKEDKVVLARQLIHSQTVEAFDPSAYKDEVEARIRAAIQKKVQGKEISLSSQPTRAQASNVIDLMSALKASLGSKRVEARGLRKTTRRVERRHSTRPGARA
jgi:non-homologous end joining protein Ku